RLPEECGGRAGSAIYYAPVAGRCCRRSWSRNACWASCPSWAGSGWQARPNRCSSEPRRTGKGMCGIVGYIGQLEAAPILLEGEGHRFYTDTDTEALAHLIEAAPGDTLEARVIAALEHVEGTYGLAVLDAHDPEKIVVARRGSPVLLGIGEDEYFVASDASA